MTARQTELKLQTRGFERAMTLQVPFAEAFDAFDGVLVEGTFESARPVTTDADPEAAEADDSTHGQVMQQSALARIRVQTQRRMPLQTQRRRRPFLARACALGRSPHPARDCASSTVLQ